MNAREANTLANKKYKPALERMKKTEMDKILKGIKKQAKLGQFFYSYRITEKNYNIDVYEHILEVLKDLGYTVYSNERLEITWDFKD